MSYTWPAPTSAHDTTAWEFTLGRSSGDGGPCGAVVVTVAQWRTKAGDVNYEGEWGCVAPFGHDGYHTPPSRIIAEVQAAFDRVLPGTVISERVVHPLGASIDAGREIC